MPVWQSQLLSACLYDASIFLLPVISTGRDFCQPGDVLQITSPSTSYIASIITKNSGCGSDESPWLIEAPPGQHIILTLTDFAASDNNDADINTCLVYAQVKVKYRNGGNNVCFHEHWQNIIQM